MAPIVSQYVQSNQINSTNTSNIVGVTVRVHFIFPPWLTGFDGLRCQQCVAHTLARCGARRDDDGRMGNTSWSTTSEHPNPCILEGTSFVKVGTLSLCLWKRAFGKHQNKMAIQRRFLIFVYPFLQEEFILIWKEGLYWTCGLTSRITNVFFSWPCRDVN